jgi:hypothetical protein
MASGLQTGTRPGDLSPVAAQQQPDDRVGRRLARTDDDVPARRRVQLHELPDRDDACAVADGERRRRLGRDVRGQVTRVDDPAGLRHLVLAAGHAGHEPAVADVLAAREVLDPAGRQHAVGEHVAVVGADVGGGRPLEQTLLRPVVLDASAAEHGRGDAVERGRLVQPHERVGAEPVPADPVAPIDQRDPDVGVVDQGVRERHAHGAGSHHEVVRRHRACPHGLT